MINAYCNTNIHTGTRQRILQQSTMKERYAQINTQGERDKEMDTNEVPCLLLCCQDQTC